MNKLTPIFLLFSVAVMFWLSASSLSAYLAKDLEREQHAKKLTTEVKTEDSTEISFLKEKLEQDPENEQSYLNLADALVAEAQSASNPQLIMQAVDALNRLLKKSPENPEALFRLAELCLQFNIIDKALDYYPRYLKKRPNDLRAKTNYGLTLLQAQDAYKAIATFNEIIEVDKQNFPAILSLALSHRMLGDFKKAKEVAEKAKEAAPDAAAKVKVDEFISGLSEEPKEEAQTSPAQKISSFFREHEIIGPKIKEAKWSNEKTYELYLEEFPVNKMPPFAKEKLVARVKGVLAEAGEGYRVVLRDVGGEELMVIM